MWLVHLSSTLVTAMAMASLNRLRGSGFEGKVIAIPCMAVLLLVDAGMNLDFNLRSWEFLALAAGICASVPALLLPGWGKYFPWLKPTFHEVEFPAADLVANMLCGKYGTQSNDKEVLNWKTMAMSARWVICAVPLLVVLALAGHSFVPALGLLGFCAAGPVYRWSLKSPVDGLETAEIIMGAWMGAFLHLIIINS